MIDIDNLTTEDVGRAVIYTNGVGEEEYGRIKSWNDKWIFVVYNCADDWANYDLYTAAATDPKDLRLLELKPGEDDINSRFEILDL